MATKHYCDRCNREILDPKDVLEGGGMTRRGDGVVVAVFRDTEPKALVATFSRLNKRNELWDLCPTCLVALLEWMNS